MKIGKTTPKAPPAPDPTVTANAQSQANIQTAREQQRLNMINSYGPQGSVVYQYDPSAPGGYSQTTNLSAGEQQTYDLSKLAQNSALGVANDQIGRVGSALSQPLDTNGLPALQSSAGLGAGSGIQSSFNMGQPLQYSFNQGQAVQGSVGGDLNSARQQAIDAAYGQATSRLDPAFDRRQSQLETKLANQGLASGSDAWNTAMDQFGRERSDAYNQATYASIGAGEDAAQNLFGRQLQQGQFANDAASQMYGQNLGAAQFHNQTSGQDYTQNLGAADFRNQAQNQAFQQNLAAAQFDNQARNQGLQERAYIQNQPINQFSALMGMGQVGMPQGVQYTPSQVAPTDVLGSYALNQQAQNNAYQAKMNQNSGLMGGLFSLGSAAIMASDERLKRDLVKISERPDGIGIWSYRYHWEDVPRVGVLAQEVERVRPDLVYRYLDGSLAVNYAGL